jgi:hypothetical protein
MSDTYKAHDHYSGETKIAAIIKKDIDVRKENKVAESSSSGDSGTVEVAKNNNTFNLTVPPDYLTRNNLLE